MLTKIRTWGNSLGLRIPRLFAEQARVRSGSPVDLSVEQGRLVIRPAPRPRFELRRLLSQVSRRNLHSAFGTGRPVGREVW